mmetsp:Transcript_34540/g.83744  ORF Transcript_34540/g.83744 Transcript_34540/m.83744 type:complete len:366 (+) Transcript_34540:70-1167(+)
MIYRRPWKSDPFSSLPALPKSSTSDCDDDSSLPASSESRSTRRSSLVFFWIPIFALIIVTGTGLFITQQPEDYGGNRAAICAIQKGAVRYLDEWVQYHLLAMGFEDIYLYDNSDDFELEAWYQSYDPQLQKRIHIQHFPGLRRQNKAYTQCTKQIQNRRWHAWIAFIDIDEFVVLRDTQRYPYIYDFLESLPKYYGGLAVNWVTFRLNNHTHYKDLPVTLRFQNRTENATSQHIKTIARTHLLRKALNPHYVGYLFLLQWRRWIRTYDTRGNIVDGALNPALADEQIAIYHYLSKSLEEYKEKCSRGRADKPKKEWRSTMACKTDRLILKDLLKAPESIKDDAPWQLLKERVPAYANKYITASTA